jgi:hypothetical protein
MRGSLWGRIVSFFFGIEREFPSLSVLVFNENIIIGITICLSMIDTFGYCARWLDTAQSLERKEWNPDIFHLLESLGNHVIRGLCVGEQWWNQNT